MEELEGHEADAPLRYLVTLELVRRRVLRIVDRQRDDDGDRQSVDSPAHPDLLVACRKRDREYRVREVPPQEATAPGVEQRLAALLWSGGAA